ncbi:hypothetical protein KR054_002410 [Drosophila jambulina]|nr:hypothetical protein KR054_002410 [Drosophila jambulina]
MLNGSSKKFGLASWPPGAHLLNFPQPREPQNPRVVSVHFQSPPDRVVNIGPPRRLGLNQDNGRAGGQLENEENNRMLRKKFAWQCYIMACVFCVISTIQMVIITWLIKPSPADTLPGFVCIVTALMALFFLSILDRLRKIIWMSIVLSALFVELVCVGLTLILVQRTLLMVGIALLAACFLILVAYLLGAWVPKVVQPGERVMLFVLLLFAAISICLLIMHIFTDDYIYATIYFILLLVILIPVSTYHAQVVHGRRFRLPAYEFVICATFMYLHFLLFFSATFYCLWFFEV